MMPVVSLSCLHPWNVWAWPQGQGHPKIPGGNTPTYFKQAEVWQVKKGMFPCLSLSSSNSQSYVPYSKMPQNFTLSFLCILSHIGTHTTKPLTCHWDGSLNTTLVSKLGGNVWACPEGHISCISQLPAPTDKFFHVPYPLPIEAVVLRNLIEPQNWCGQAFVLMAFASFIFKNHANLAVN